VLLVDAFVYHSLKRRPLLDRDEFVQHVVTSCPAHNRLYAQPFEWMCINPKMPRWFGVRVPLKALPCFLRRSVCHLDGFESLSELLPDGRLDALAT
jgi:hypothetical protein